MQRKIADAKQVIDELRQKGILRTQLALFGGSEGGAVVAVLGSEIDDVSSIAILSMGTGQTLVELFPQIVSTEALESAQKWFVRIRRDPGAKDIWLGHSVRWWADIMDQRLSDYLIESQVPVLLVHGEKDALMPVSSSRATRDLFLARGNAQLTYWEYENLNHTMMDPEGVSFMDQVLERIVFWFSQDA